MDVKTPSMYGSYTMYKKCIYKKKKKKKNVDKIIAMDKEVDDITVMIQRKRQRVVPNISSRDKRHGTMLKEFY